MTKRDRKLLTAFLMKYFQIEKDEIMEEDEIMECITTLITEGIFHDVRSLQIAIGRHHALIVFRLLFIFLQKQCIIDHLFRNQNACLSSNCNL